MIKRKVLSLFLKIEVLLLDLIVSGKEFHRTGAAWVKARPPNVEHLTLGTDRRSCGDERYIQYNTISES